MNEFFMSYGQLPKHYIGRDAIIDDLIMSYDLVYTDARSTFITGVRGSGKTTMLTSITQKLDKKKWIIIKIPDQQNIWSRVLSILSRDLSSPLSVLKLNSISLSGANLSVDQIEMDMLSQIEQLLSIAKQKNKKVLFVIDEIQISDKIRAFLSSFQMFMSDELPVYLLSAGLPQSVLNVVEDKYLTFLLRSKKIELRNLNIEPILDLYLRETDMSPEIAIKLAELSKGYPYAVQVLGYYGFKAKTNDELVSAVSLAQYTLSTSAYKKILDDLTLTELEFLTYMSNDETNTSDIVQQTGWDKTQVNIYKNRLIDKNIIKQTRRGAVEPRIPWITDAAIQQFKKINEVQQ